MLSVHINREKLVNLRLKQNFIILLSTFKIKNPIIVIIINNLHNFIFFIILIHVKKFIANKKQKKLKNLRKTVIHKPQKEQLKKTSFNIMLIILPLKKIENI